MAEHDLWVAEPFRGGHAWRDLGLLANDEGRFDLGVAALAWRWRWSEAKAKACLDELVKQGLLTCQTVPWQTVISLMGQLNRQFIGHDVRAGSPSNADATSWRCLTARASRLRSVYGFVSRFLTKAWKPETRRPKPPISMKNHRFLRIRLETKAAVRSTLVSITFLVPASSPRRRRVQSGSHRPLPSLSLATRSCP